MAIQMLRATAIHCTPSYATYFAEWIKREAGLDPRELGLKKLFCGAEPGAGIPAVRARLQEAWGARVTDRGATGGHTAGGPSLAGLRKAKEQGWTPDAAASGNGGPR